MQFIALNAGKAFELFQRYIVKKSLLLQHIQYQRVPSTSPAQAGMTFEAKKQHWLAALASYLHHPLTLVCGVDTSFKN